MSISYINIVWHVLSKGVRLILSNLEFVVDLTVHALIKVELTEFRIFYFFNIEGKIIIAELLLFLDDLLHLLLQVIYLSLVTIYVFLARMLQFLVFVFQMFVPFFQVINVLCFGVQFLIVIAYFDSQLLVLGGNISQSLNEVFNFDVFLNKLFLESFKLINAFVELINLIVFLFDYLIFFVQYFTMIDFLVQFLLNNRILLLNSLLQSVNCMS